MQTNPNKTTPHGAAACPVDAPLLLSDQQVADLLSLSRRTVWKLVSTGELPRPLRIGRASRFERSAIIDFVEGLKGEAKE